MNNDGGVLGDLTVLELSQGIPGAYCGKLLAGLGARVIKLEPPAGESGRRLPPFVGDDPHLEKSGSFLYLNTNKESITLDLSRAEGRQIFGRLVPRVDVVVENFSPGTLAGWGLDAGALSTLNPRLILVSITPFGQGGPYREYAAPEIVAEATGGLMSTIGLPEREPLKIGGSLALYNAGGAAFSAIMAAIWQRDQTGAGQVIEISIQEATAVSQIHASVLAAWHGTSSTRQPSTLLEAADGWASVGLEMGVSAETWPRLCQLMGRPELAEDARFSTAAARRENREALLDLVRDWVHGQRKETVYHRLQGLRSIAGYVATTEDLYRSHQLEERRYFQEIAHPIVSSARYPGPPFRFEGVAGAPWTARGAPLLGEQNEAIFRGELGLSEGELRGLREIGVV